MTSPQRTSVPGAPAAPGRTSHLRLTRRGRVVIVLAFALPVAALIASFAANSSSATANGASATVHYEYAQIEAGQSLWQLAVALAPSADPRDVVADIVRLNGLPSAVVQPGQSLAIPTSYSG